MYIVAIRILESIHWKLGLEIVACNLEVIRYSGEGTYSQSVGT